MSASPTSSAALSAFFSVMMYVISIFSDMKDSGCIFVSHIFQKFFDAFHLLSTSSNVEASGNSFITPEFFTISLRTATHIVADHLKVKF